MKTPSLTKNARSRTRRPVGRFSQEFVAEPDVPAEHAVSSAGQSGSLDAEPFSPTQRGTTVFRLEVPAADTVKLVADFTGWDKRPLDLTQAEKGVWRLTVALPPGRYAYRFLVDGEWCDDPSCQHCEPNPFGTRNAVIEVA